MNRKIAAKDVTVARSISVKLRTRASARDPRPKSKSVDIFNDYQTVRVGGHWFRVPAVFFVFESCNASIALTASISRVNQNLRLPHEQINVSVQFSPMPSGYRSSSPFWLLCPHVAFAYIYANRIGRRMNKPSLARTIL